jgi:stage V sporulation protein G
MINITEIRITPRGDDRLRAFVSITLDGCFVVRGLKIIEGKQGRLFVAMPSRKKPDGTYQDVAHPITPDFRNHLEDLVIGEYNRLLQSGALATMDRSDEGEFFSE